MYDLEKITTISFEVGIDCNLKYLHSKCPINYRKANVDCEPMSDEKIIQTMDDSISMSFKGLFSFHFYNEPMLYIDRILKIIESRKNYRYLLWTNGTLFDNNVENNDFIKNFELVVITCYSEERLKLYSEIKNHYGNVKININDLDNRLQTNINEFGCKMMLYKLPIDYWGNVYLCVKDWKNEYKIGSINFEKLMNIVSSDKYQKAREAAEKRLLDKHCCPNVCLTCSEPWLIVPPFWKKIRNNEYGSF